MHAQTKLVYVDDVNAGGLSPPCVPPDLLNPPLCRRTLGTVAIGYDPPPLRGVLAVLSSAELRIAAATFSMREEKRKSESRSVTAISAAYIPVPKWSRAWFVARMTITYGWSSRRAGRRSSRPRARRSCRAVRRVELGKRLSVFVVRGLKDVWPTQGKDNIEDELTAHSGGRTLACG